MKTIDYYENISNESMKDELQRHEEISLKVIRDYFENQNNTRQSDFRLLDAGCGNGRFLSTVRKMGEGVALYGVDYSENQLSFAKKSSDSSISYSQADLNEGIPFDDNYFDVIYTSEVIEHLLDPDFFIKEIKRATRKNALIVLTTPNFNNWLSRIMFLFGSIPMFYEASTERTTSGFGFFRRFKKQDYPVGHIRVLNLDALKCLFRYQGLEIQRVYGLPYEGFSGLMHRLDSLVSKIVTLSSDFVVVATNNGE